MEKETVNKRITASLMCGALGDALGYAVEFMDFDTILERYGSRGITELDLEDGLARFSDDTQMTLFTAEGYILGYRRATERGIDASVDLYIHEAYLCWLKTQGYPAESLWMNSSRLVAIPELNHCRAPGNTCLSALVSGDIGAIEAPLNNSKGCGGVMRTAPLGFVRRSDGSNPFGSPLVNGAKAAAITHGHPMGYIPAGMLSDIVDRCIYENYDSLEELVTASFEATEALFAGYEGMERFEEMIRLALTLAAVPVEEDEGVETDEAAISEIGEGWVGDEALAIAIYAAIRHRDDVKAALRAASNHSGDSDSTAAIAGNILGAWLGEYPADWAEKLELAGTIRELADDMTDIAFEN